MKNRLLLVILSILLVFGFSTCDWDWLNDFFTEDEIDIFGDSSLTIKVLFQTATSQIANIRLSIRNTNSVYIVLDTLPSAQGNFEPLNGVHQDFPGRYWTGTFTELRASTYAPGSLKIELLDSTGKVITSGYNSVSVTTVDEETSTVNIIPIPVISTYSESLSLNEMKFVKIDLIGGLEYSLTLTAEETYPDIILFNNDGTYFQYYSINEASDTEIQLSSAQDFTYYAGIYANKGNVSQYSVSLKFPLLDSEFFNDFTNLNELDEWTLTQSSPGISLAEIVYENTERGNVIVFNAFDTFGGLKSSISRTITSPTPMALSFLIKTDLNNNFGVLDLYINDNKIESYAGLRGIWKAETILVGAGENKIEFVLEKKTNSHNIGDITNTVRLDNISYVPDVTVSAVLYPRGQLNTYVGAPENEKIKFHAEALRKDGTVRKNASGFVFSGAGINSGTGVFTPTAQGNIAVNVSHNGIVSASRSVTVHPANYMRLPYTYPGTNVTYQGYTGTEGSLKTTAGGVTVTYPSATTFNADGFFTLEGNVNNSVVYNYALVQVTKTSNTNLTTNYFIRDTFKQRIWLRFGPGAYTVTIRELNSINISSNLGAEGDITGYGYAGTPITFNVNNTRNDGISADGSTPDRRFIYPSYLSQSDDFRITNLASDLTYGITDDTEKLRTLHDYITSNTSYDFNSTVSGYRKKQDAITVIRTRYFEDTQYPIGHFFAVCEGYSNLFAALARASSIETRYISGNGHGWSNVYVNGWKLVDVTHNDPVRASGVVGDYGPLSFTYTYFMLDDLSRANYPHSVTDRTNERSVIPYAPQQVGAPDGWY